MRNQAQKHRLRRINVTNIRRLSIAYKIVPSMMISTLKSKNSKLKTLGKLQIAEKKAAVSLLGENCSV